MANNLNILDGLAVAKVVKTTDVAGVHTTHHNVDVIAMAPAVHHGQQTAPVLGQSIVLGAAQALQTGVVVKSMEANGANLIYVGIGAGVNTGTGFELAKGESIFMEVDNIDKVFFLGAAAPLKVCYVGG